LLEQFAVGKQSGAGGDAAAVEFQPGAAVESDLQGASSRIAPRVFHESTTTPRITRGFICKILWIRTIAMSSGPEIRA